VSTLLRDMQGYAWFFFGYEATVHYLAGPGKTKADLEYWQVSWVHFSLNLFELQCAAVDGQQRPCSDVFRACACT
jgi:hypothetical protein